MKNYLNYVISETVLPNFSPFWLYLLVTKNQNGKKRPFYKFEQIFVNFYDE